LSEVTTYPRAVDVSVEDDVLHVRYDNGITGTFLLSRLYPLRPYRRLLDPEYRAQARLEGTVVCWPRGEDINPYYLYEQVTNPTDDDTIPQEESMPVISAFLGIIIRMFYYDDKRHHLPHFHAEYAEHKASYSIEDGKLLSGSIPPAKQKLIDAWLEIHREELLANWKLCKEGSEPFRIKGLH
jgi:Domain of unknown function (DUF4160)/Protein of unknown function (DUF2442)